MEMTKHKFFDEEKQNIEKKVYVNKSRILYSELAPLTHDITCSKL